MASNQTHANSTKEQYKQVHVNEPEAKSEAQSKSVTQQEHPRTSQNTQESGKNTEETGRMYWNKAECAMHSFTVGETSKCIAFGWLQEYSTVQSYALPSKGNVSLCTG